MQTFFFIYLKHLQYSQIKSSNFFGLNSRKTTTNGVLFRNVRPLLHGKPEDRQRTQVWELRPPSGGSMNRVQQLDKRLQNRLRLESASTTTASRGSTLSQISDGKGKRWKGGGERHSTRQDGPFMNAFTWEVNVNMCRGEGFL